MKDLGWKSYLLMTRNNCSHVLSSYPKFFSELTNIKSLETSLDMLSSRV